MIIITVVNTGILKDAAKEMSKMLSNIPTQISRINKELSLCDQEISDLLHVIELTNFHASAGYNLAKDIKITRKKRRELKDELDSLIAIQKTLKKNRPAVEQSKAIMSVIGAETGRQNNRRYTPRVRKDFTETFDKL